MEGNQMMLLTKENKSKLPKLGATDGQEGLRDIIVKFFTPDSNWTWYVLEGEQLENGDWQFFGLVDGFEKELGYFNLSELQSAKGPMGLHIERDRYFDNHKLNLETNEITEGA
jgi:hypothetical protein